MSDSFFAESLSLADVMADFRPTDRARQEYEVLLAERDEARRERQENIQCAVDAREHWRQAEAENARLRAAIAWALGENGEFKTRQDGDGPFWWRRELRQRALKGGA